MPRREIADPLALAVGQRIRALRQEAGLTMEKLAYESELGSKGHLSNIEKGLVRPTVQTLKVLADHLGVLPLDLLTFPDEDIRQSVIDRTRTLSSAALRRLRRELEHNTFDNEGLQTPRSGEVPMGKARPALAAAEPPSSYGEEGKRGGQPKGSG